jgi:hypothetical protein
MDMRAGRYHRLAVRRLYFFELFVLANLALVAVLARDTFFLLGSVPRTLASLAFAFATQAAAGVVIRTLVAFVRRDRSYLRHIRRRAWLLDTARLIAGATLLVFSYGWLKLVTPLLRTSNMDAALWELDRLLAFGLSPAEFLLNLFAGGHALRAIDWAYANIFYASLVVGMGYFLSHPSRRIRVAFANGNTLLWGLGAWLYFAVPSLGPAYRFPDVWLVHESSLRVTQGLQALLMRNWQTVARSWEARQLVAPVSLAFGIAAFPSLHVGFQTYVFLWMRRLWLSGQVLFALFALTIFLGSMITGWHYLADGIAGVLLALLAYKIAIRPVRRLFSHA